MQKDVFTLRSYNGITSNHLPGSFLLADIRTLMRRMAREHGDEALRHFRFCYDLSKNMAAFRAHVSWLERQAAAVVNELSVKKNVGSPTIQEAKSRNTPISQCGQGLALFPASSPTPQIKKFVSTREKILAAEDEKLKARRHARIMSGRPQSAFGSPEPNNSLSPQTSMRSYITAMSQNKENDKIWGNLSPQLSHSSVYSIQRPETPLYLKQNQDPVKAFVSSV